MKTYSIHSSKLFFLLALLISAPDVQGQQGNLATNVKVVFTVTVASYRPQGVSPEAVGIAGNQEPLASEKQLPPALVLRESKSDPGTYSGTAEFPKGAPVSLAFTVMCRSDGLWDREPNSMGIPHLAILDPSLKSQSVSLSYDPKARRFVGQTRSGLTLDNFASAYASSKALKNESAARQYQYWNAISLLKSGKLTEAQACYDQFRKDTPAGDLAPTVYDRYPLLNATALAQSGNASRAIAVLRAVPKNEGTPDFQAEVSLRLGDLLDKGSDAEEARSIFADVQRRSGVSAELKDQGTLMQALSFQREKSPALQSRARRLLQTLAERTRSVQYRRQALIALADLHRRAKNTDEAVTALKHAGELGTVQQRVAATVQRLDLHLDGKEYDEVHAAAKWLLDQGDPGRHRAHLLWLDALALWHLGRMKESSSRYRTLDSAYAGTPYARFAAYNLSTLLAHSAHKDTVTTGARAK
jgi:hypothetical protein